MILKLIMKDQASRNGGPDSERYPLSDALDATRSADSPRISVTYQNLRDRFVVPLLRILYPHLLFDTRFSRSALTFYHPKYSKTKRTSRTNSMNSDKIEGIYDSILISNNNN